MLRAILNRGEVVREKLGDRHHCAHSGSHGSFGDPHRYVLQTHCGPCTYDNDIHGTSCDYDQRSDSHHHDDAPGHDNDSDYTGFPGHRDHLWITYGAHRLAVG